MFESFRLKRLQAESIYLNLESIQLKKNQIKLSGPQKLGGLFLNNWLYFENNRALRIAFKKVKKG